MTYTAAVITVSDKGSRGERADTSGPMLVNMLKQRGFEVLYTNIVPDERDAIRSELMKCTDDIGVSLLLTTGGTGFSKRDITPEATMDVVEKETAGIPELMRAESAKITNRACLSRSKAGIRKDTLIINLPGSEKAAKENFEAIADALDHGMDMLASSGSADCATPTGGQVYLSASTQEEFLYDGGDIIGTEEVDESLLTDMIFNENADISDNEFAEKIANAFSANEGVQNVQEDVAAEADTDKYELSGGIDVFDQSAYETAAYEQRNNRPSVILKADDNENGKNIEKEKTPVVRLKKEYFSVPDDAFVKSQTYNGKKIPPKMDEWMREAKADINASKCGMYLTHNGIVRADARAKVRDGVENAKPVTGMSFSYNPSEVKAAIEEAYQLEGIYYIRVWLNEGELDVGDDIMYVLIGGDIRPNVVDALQSLVAKIKDSCVTEKELF